MKYWRQNGISSSPCVCPLALMTHGGSADVKCMPSLIRRGTASTRSEYVTVPGAMPVSRTPT